MFFILTLKRIAVVVIYEGILHWLNSILHFIVHIALGYFITLAYNVL